MSLASTLKQHDAEQAANLAPHAIIKALAGTGKTTTLIEALKVLFGFAPSIVPSIQQADVWATVNQSKGVSPFAVAFVAFNKSIASELQRRVPTGVSAMTMHSMGLKAVTAAFGRVQIHSYRVQDIISEILEKDIRDIRKDDFELLQATEKLVNLCKMNLLSLDGYYTEDNAPPADYVSVDTQLDGLCAHYDIDLNGSRQRVYDLVPRVLERCKDVKRDNKIDFADMIWLPVVLNLGVIHYDLLLVDEAQDLNRCQQALAKKAGKRLILCGDVHQAIYGFAGADSESMDRMEEELKASPAGCVVLPLTVTRRCGKAIVAEAQRIVPEFEAHGTNPEGSILYAGFKGIKPNDAGEGPIAYVTLVEEGDMILCRCNAPLVSECFRFLKADRLATIQGKDVGQGLISTIKKLKANDVPDLVGKLSDWLHAETEKENRKRIPNEQRVINLNDRHDCLICFTDNATSVEGIIKRIEDLFTDAKDGRGITLSSIHKAKGLERKRVFLLEPVGATVPHPMAKSAWQRGQEMNLRYVAITRAISELVYVTGAADGRSAQVGKFSKAGT